MNKRAHIRHYVAMPARLILGEEPGRTCQVQDFCLGGMLLSLPEPGLPAPENLPIDTSVRLALDVQGLRGMRRVILPARIRRQTGTAVGVAFDHADAKDLLAVQRHVRVLLQKERCGAPDPDPQPGPPDTARPAVGATASAAKRPPTRSLYDTAWRLAQYRHASGWHRDEPGAIPEACRTSLARALLPFQREGLGGQALPAVVKHIAQAARLNHGPALQAQAELVQSVTGALAANPALDEELRSAMVRAQVPVLRLLLEHEFSLDAAEQPLARLLDLVVALGLRGRTAEGLAVFRTIATKESISISNLNYLVKHLHEVFQRVDVSNPSSDDTRHVADQAACTVTHALDAAADRLYQQLSHAARHDAVTGLLTWAELKRRLGRESDFRGTLVWVEPGHDPHAPVSRQGNELLRYIGSVLKEMFHNRLVARAEQRGFVLWLASTGLVAGQTAVEAFRRRLNTTRAGQDVSLKLSFGLAERQPLQCADSLILDAKSACAVAESRGGGLQVAALPDAGSAAIRAFSPDEEARVVLQTRHAASNSSAQGPVCIVEARLVAARDGVVAPRGFTGLSLHHSQMPALDRRVITNLLRWLHRNAHAAGRYDLFLLRLSRLSLRDSRFPDFLREQFQRYSIAPARICLEFAEGNVAEDVEAATRRMRAFKETGCSLALGGLGMAEIPLTRLRTLPMDLLVPDEALVASLCDEEPGTPALIQGLVDIARLIKCKTLVCGIPDTDTSRHLRDIGVDWIERVRSARETQPDRPLRGEPTETSY